MPDVLQWFSKFSPEDLIKCVPFGDSYVFPHSNNRRVTQVVLMRLGFLESLQPVLPLLVHTLKNKQTKRQDHHLETWKPLVWVSFPLLADSSFFSQSLILAKCSGFAKQKSR